MEKMSLGLGLNLGMQTKFAAAAPVTGNVLLEDAVSHLLLEDGSSHLLLE